MNRIILFAVIAVIAVNMLTLLYKITIEMDFELLALLFINALLVLYLVNSK